MNVNLIVKKLTLHENQPSASSPGGPLGELAQGEDSEALKPVTESATGGSVRKCLEPRCFTKKKGWEPQVTMTSMIFMSPIFS